MHTDTHIIHTNVTRAHTEVYSVFRNIGMIA